MNQTITHHTLHLIHHYLSTTHQDHLHVHPQHLFHPGKVQWNPVQRNPHLKAGKDASLSQLSSWPQDINNRLTPGLSALLQETSPLVPYKKERSAKAKAREAFSTMHWTLLIQVKISANWLISRPLQLHIQTLNTNWLISRPQQWPIWHFNRNWLISRPLQLRYRNSTEIDFFQDPFEEGKDNNIQTVTLGFISRPHTRTRRHNTEHLDSSYFIS